MARATPLREWVPRGERSRFVVRSLRDQGAVFTDEAVSRALSLGKAMHGRSYEGEKLVPIVATSIR